MKKITAQQRYDAAKMKHVGLKIKKELAARIDEGARRAGVPRARYITNAVLKQLELDGIPEQVLEADE